MVLALLGVATAVVAIVVAISARRILAAQRETQRVRSVFSRYVSPAVLDEVLERHDPRVLSSKSGYATILVCRIWNFALFAEQLDHSEALRYVNEFYTLAGRSIHKHRGMVDKFLSDGISSAFGFPIEDPLQEEHAIRAAIELIRLVDGMNMQWASQGRKPIKVGIGINSGNVVAGEVGFLQRREYTVMGLPAIIASRLQERTEPMGASILVSDATLEPVRDSFATVSAGTVPLRGMKGTVKGFMVRGLARNIGERDLLLPPPAAFPQTRIEEDGVGAHWDTHDQGSSEPETRTPPPIDKPKAPEPVAEAKTKFEIPEVKGFGAVDDSPALPDPIVAEGYYEDDSGRPPLRLPP